MAKWRDKQSQDYEIPSDEDRLEEIRRRYAQAPGRSEAESPDPGADRREATGKRPNSRYFSAFTVFLLALAGAGIFEISRQNEIPGAGVESAMNRLEMQIKQIDTRQQTIDAGIKELMKDIKALKKKKFPVSMADIREIGRRINDVKEITTRNGRNIDKILRKENLDTESNSNDQ